MSFESGAFSHRNEKPKNEIENTDELDPKVRGRTLDRIVSASPDEFNNAIAAAGLSGSEKISLEHWRESSNLVERTERGDEVRGLYMAAKHPTMNKVFNALHVKPEVPWSELKKYQSLNAKEEQFTLGDFESAIEKISKHLE